MRVPLLRLAALFVVMLTGACGDGHTLTEIEQSPPDLTIVALGEEHQAPSCCDPVIVIVKGPEECDPYLTLTGCPDDGGACMASTGDAQTTSGCLPGLPGGGTGPCDPAWDPTCAPAGGETPCDPTWDPTCPRVAEGPGAFAACVGGLLFLMGTTAMMEPLAHNVYDAREDYASATRMYDAVMANNPTLEMELHYAHRVEAARSSYRDALRDYALAAGASVFVVGAAVVVCSPGLILPTP
jgi:hypothetical protein